MTFAYCCHSNVAVSWYIPEKTSAHDTYKRSFCTRHIAEEASAHDTCRGSFCTHNGRAIFCTRHFQNGKQQEEIPVPDNVDRYNRMVSRLSKLLFFQTDLSFVDCLLPWADIFSVGLAILWLVEVSSNIILYSFTHFIAAFFFRSLILSFSDLDSFTVLGRSIRLSKVSGEVLMVWTISSCSSWLDRPVT